MLTDGKDKFNVNILLEELTSGALEGIGVEEIDQTIELEQPMIITGITITGVNDKS